MHGELWCMEVFDPALARYTNCRIAKDVYVSGGVCLQRSDQDAIYIAGGKAITPESLLRLLFGPSHQLRSRIHRLTPHLVERSQIARGACIDNDVLAVAPD